MNTKISYLYRDADNYKRYNECIVAGTLSAKQICTILDCCDMGEYEKLRVTTVNQLDVIKQKEFADA